MSSVQTTTYTIREASRASGLSISTLRYYETVGIIPPIARDASGKNRLYTDDDLNMLVSISCLSAAGMSLVDMRRYLDHRGGGMDVADEQIALFLEQKERLLRDEQQLKVRQQYIDLKVGYWKAVAVGDETARQNIAEKSQALAKQLNETV